MIFGKGNKAIVRSGLTQRRLRQPGELCRYLLIALGLLIFASTSSHADTPVTLYESLAGNINITGTAGTLRTAADGTNSCSVQNNGTMQLSGVPAGSTIVRAYLYWAGSGGDPAGGAAADYCVTFIGTNVTADRSYTASYNNGGNLLNFFGGVKNVTSMIAGNGVYTFSNLTVQNADVAGGGSYCTSAAVLSAFSLVVVYSNPSETLHVVNIWEGLQTYRGASIALIPSNFTVPTPAPVTALSSRHLVLTWEGDSGNSGASGGFNENLTFCAPSPCAGVALTDAYNPINGQFNSTVDIPPSGPFSGINTTWGVDLDMYDITGLLSAGNASAQAIYSSGADLVILANQTMSIANVPVADLAITKSHVGNFVVGTNGVYTLNVTNNGPSDTSGTITVTDTLPVGLTYVSATGTGWACSAAGQTVTCTMPSPLVNGATAPAITLTVSVGAAAIPSVINRVSVTSGAFDNIAGNSTNISDPTTVVRPDLSSAATTKTVVDLDGGNPYFGDTLEYTITVTESGGAAATGVSVTDNIPANVTGFTVVSIPAGATDSSTPTGGANGTGWLNITNITVPAGGSVTIIYDVTISGAPGSAITNNATIANPNGPGASRSAPTLTVQNSTGNNKPLYLYDNTYPPNWKLSRAPATATTSGTNSITLAAGATQAWTLDPVLASSVTLQSSVGFPAVLNFARAGGGNGNCQLQATLSCSNGTTTGAGSFNAACSTTAAVRTITIPLNGTINCPNPFTWRLNVTNPAAANRTMVVYPYTAAYNSHVDLPSLNVINVNSIGFYSAPSPGGAAITNVTPGTTVYIRASVTDPFGNADITGATLTLTDSTGTPRVFSPPATVWNQVLTPDAATKIFEYAYTIPPAGPTGNWTVRVDAREGSEGLVSHYAQTTLPVVPFPNITITKSAFPGSAKPGDIINYQVQVQNNVGGGPATLVELTDILSVYTALRLKYNGIDPTPFQYTDNGPPNASGLLPGAISYSSNYGADGFSYIPSDQGGGYNGNVTNWKIIMNNTMNQGSSGFTLRYQMKVK